MPDMIKFQQGRQSLLSKQPIANGTLWFTTDEGAIYLDTGDQRVRFGDYVIVDNIAALPAAGHAYESALYYAKAENVLARWDVTNTKWVQLNAAGLTQVKINGSGNVLAGATVTLDSDTGAKVLTFTTASVATSEGMEGLATRVTSLEGRMDAVEGRLNVIEGEGAGSIKKAVADATADLQAKIDAVDALADKGIADAAKVQENLDGVTTRVTSAEGKITALENAVGEGGNIDTRLQTLKNEILGDENSAAGSVTVAGANKAAAAAQSTANDALSQANTNKEAIEGHGTRLTAAEGDIDDLEAAVAVLNGTAETAGSVLHTVNDRIATVVDGAPAAFDTLREIAEWIGSDEANTGAAETLASYGNRLDGLEESVEGHGTRLTSVEGDIERLEQSITSTNSNLKNELFGDATAGTTLGSLQDAIESNDTDITNLQKDVSDAQGVIEGHGTRLTSAEGNINSLIQRVDQAEDNIEDLQKVRGEFAAADTALKNELIGTATTYKNFGAVETALGTQADNINGLTTRMSSVENQLTWVVFS